MSEIDLTTQFKKTFFFSFQSKKHLPRFESLTEIQQRAVIQLRHDGFWASEAFDAVAQANPDDLLLRFDETVDSIYLDHYDRRTF